MTMVNRLKILCQFKYGYQANISRWCQPFSDGNFIQRNTFNCHLYILSASGPFYPLNILSDTLYNKVALIWVKGVSKYHKKQLKFSKYIYVSCVWDFYSVRKCSVLFTTLYSRVLQLFDYHHGVVVVVPVIVFFYGCVKLSNANRWRRWWWWWWWWWCSFCRTSVFFCGLFVEFLFCSLPNKSWRCRRQWTLPVQVGAHTYIPLQVVALHHQQEEEEEEEVCKNKTPWSGEEYVSKL